MKWFLTYSSLNIWNIRHVWEKDVIIALVRSWSHQPLLAPSVSISGWNSVKSGGQHRFLNITPNNLRTRTRQKVFCDQDLVVDVRHPTKWISTRITTRTRILITMQARTPSQVVTINEMNRRSKDSMFRGRDKRQVLRLDRGEPAVSYKWTGWVWELTVEVQDCRKSTDHFQGIYRIYPNLIKKNRSMSTCNRLD